MTKKRMLHGVTLTLILAVAVFVWPLPVLADYEVFVGYADNVRPSPFFPNPWSGSANVDLFAGNPTGASPPANTIDSGAVMIKNTGVTNLVLNSISVGVPSWSSAPNFHPADLTNEWAAFAGSFPITLGPGHMVIFTQNASFNLDTSDFGISGLSPNNDPTNNCGTGAQSTIPACIAARPTVTATVDGTPTTFTDTGHVLDTGGFDGVNSNPCFAPGDFPGNCNESLQWRPIGTTGTENPGGVPEPSTLLLLCSGLVGLGGLAWRRHRRT